jgi:two-component system cell cycle sensor histidine kinase/response regulator CckA
MPRVKRILLVDDDGLMLTLMSKALPDFDVTIARDGEEAFAIASQLRIDLLITDYLMPSMMGDELIGRLRERRPDLKVLVVTGHGGVLADEDPIWWQSEAHLTKPFRVDALREAVIRLIGLPMS